MPKEVKKVVKIVKKEKTKEVKKEVKKVVSKEKPKDAKPKQDSVEIKSPKIPKIIQKQIDRMNTTTKDFGKVEKYTFPLYKTLLEDIDKNKYFRKNDRKTLLSNIKKCNDEGKKLIYALIRFHQLISENNENELPYKSTYENKKFSFSVDNLPSLLKKILLSFTILHLKKMKDDDRLNEERGKNLDELLDN